MAPSLRLIARHVLTSDDKNLTLGDMSSLIRSSSLTGFPALVGSLGGQAEPLLRQAGIRPEAISDPDDYISYRALVTVLDLAARRHDCPDLGLRLSAHQGLDILGPVGVIARHATSVGDALDGIARFLYQYSPAIEIAVETAGAETEYHFRIRPRVLRTLIDVAQIGELSLGTSLQIFRILIGPEFTPFSASLLHRPAAPTATYEDYFGCPVAVEQDHWGFRFSSGVLNRPVEGSDPAVRRLALEYLSGMVGGALGNGLPAEVRSTVKRALPTRRFSLEDVADSFALHPALCNGSWRRTGRRSRRSSTTCATNSPTGICARRRCRSPNSPTCSGTASRAASAAPAAAGSAARRRHSERPQRDRQGCELTGCQSLRL